MRAKSGFSGFASSISNRWRSLAIYLFYLLVAVVVTWPLAGHLSSRLVGFPYGDSTEMARHIWWYNHALRTGQPVFWQPLLGYPDGMEGVILWADPLQFFPAWLLAFFLPVPAAANVSILLYMALNGWAMQALAHYLLDRRRGPALLAGLVFMAAPVFQGHLGGGHAGLMVLWPVPLYLLALLRLRDAGTGLNLPHPRHAAHDSPSLLVERGSGGEVEREISPSQYPQTILSQLRSFLTRLNLRWFALAALMFALSPSGHPLQTIYVLMPVTALFVLWQAWRREWGGLARTLLAVAVGGAILSIFILPVAQTTLDTPAYTQEGGFVRYSADLLGIVSPSFFHPLYGGLGYTRQVLGVNLEEGSSYIGIVAGVLALIGLWRSAPELSRIGPRWWLLLALVAWVLSLGPLLKILDTPVRLEIDGYSTHITLPWAWVQNLPFFSLARTPGRFNFTLALAVAALAGYGAARLWDWLADRRRLKIATIGVLMLAVLGDYQWYWPLPTFSATIPAAVHDLRERDDLRAVFDIPWDDLVAAKEGLYLQTAHQKPLVAGHVSRSTPVNPAKLSLLEGTLNPALLRAAGADVVIAHKAYASDALLARAQAMLGAPVYEDEQLAIFETPDTGASPKFATLAATDAAIERNLDSFVYAPTGGWVDFAGTLAGAGQTVALYLDQERVHQWQVEDDLSFALSLPVDAEAYHTITLALDPPCPANDDPALVCPAVEVRDLRLGNFTPADGREVAFGQGVTLLNSMADGHARAGQLLAVRLLWAFDAARDENDIRFVHVVDSAGRPVAQDDRTLGDHQAGTQWAEMVAIQLPDDLPAGEYHIYTGWYTYPDFARFPVLTAVDGAQDGLALLGAVTIAK